MKLNLLEWVHFESSRCPKACKALRFSFLRCRRWRRESRCWCSCDRCGPRPWRGCPESVGPWWWRWSCDRLRRLASRWHGKSQSLKKIQVRFKFNVESMQNGIMLLVPQLHKLIEIKAFSCPKYCNINY